MGKVSYSAVASAGIAMGVIFPVADLAVEKAGKECSHKTWMHSKGVDVSPSICFSNFQDFLLHVFIVSVTYMLEAASSSRRDRMTTRET